MMIDMKWLGRFLFENSLWNDPFLTAFFAGFVFIGADGKVYRTKAGDAYLKEIGQ